MDIYEINTILKKYNLIESDAEFSRNCLGKSSRYFSTIKSSNGKFSVTAKLHLAKILRQYAYDIGYRKNRQTNTLASEMRNISDAVFDEIVGR